MDVTHTALARRARCVTSSRAARARRAYNMADKTRHRAPRWRRKTRRIDPEAARRLTSVEFRRFRAAVARRRTSEDASWRTPERRRRRRRTAPTSDDVRQSAPRGAGDANDAAAAAAAVAAAPRQLGVHESLNLLLV